MSSNIRLDDRGARAGAGRPIVFVSDPTAEAERITRALRAGGATVVEVPLSMLVARAAVQPPQVVLVDADSHGALDVVSRMRELPHADDIHVIFVAGPGGTLSTPQDALAHEGSALVLRPVDIPALVRDLESLRGVRAEEPLEPSHTSTPPPSVAVSTPKGSISSPSLPPPSIRSASFPMAIAESTGPPEPGARGGAPPASGIGVAPPVSPELRRLLAEAEDRMATAAHLADHDAAPSPEQELEAVLPAELLAALDEPLDGDDETETPPAPRSAPASRAPRDHTSDGGLPRTTGASTGGGTPSAGPHPATGDSATAAPDGRPARDSAAPAPGARRPSAAPAAPPPPWLGSNAGDASAALARAVASRTSGGLCFASGGVERRVVLREGDVVTSVSAAEDESLIAFLGARGDLPRETVRRLAPKFASYGRHAGAALVARGYLLQDQMWPTLRAHAEWVLGRVVQSGDARIVFEPQPAGRLSGEPSVFGGSTGGQVFVEVIRRIVEPDAAIERLGGVDCRLTPGPAAALLEECIASPAELETLRDADGRTLAEVLEIGGPDGDLASAIFALCQLGVVDVIPAVGGARPADEPAAAADPSALDSAAIRERVRARLQAVEDGDYFAVLGVPRAATGYEIRRAFLELRRAFDPSRLLSPDLADLIEDVRTIAAVLEEAYEILKDSARRDRYRRAIEVVPE